MGVIWGKRRIPEDWKLSIICPIHKKGEKFKEPELRGMLLLCTAYITFATILRNKLEPYTKKQGGGTAWAGHVARIGEERGVYRVLLGKPEGKRPLGRPRRRWVDNIRMDLQEVGCGYID